jgi:hypothetical protein
MIRELLNTYYDGLNRKDGWQAQVSEAITFASPNGAVTHGKAAFVEGNSRFLRAVKSANRKHMLTDGDSGCAWVSYDLRSPRGHETTLEVVEIWTATNGQLDSLRIYFDTAAFASFMQAA